MSFFSCAVLSQPCLTCQAEENSKQETLSLLPPPPASLPSSSHCSAPESLLLVSAVMVRSTGPTHPSILAHGRTQQVVLAASICTRGGKAVLSRQFREIARSRIEALLASFPKLADSGTQHTTVEQDNVRFVYQPLDELYIVLITNRQSNILQDIDSLHLFAQVTTSICKSLDEREILRNAFELLSAFDELVTVGYRENLSLSQIKSFLEMESHEERIQEIIERVLLSVSVHCQQLTEISRTKSSRPVKNAKERRSSWRCSGKRPLVVVAQWLRDHRPIPFTHPRPVPLCRIHTTAMRQRRRNHSPST